MQIIDKLAWIKVKDHKLLATKSKGKEILYMPGGKREQGESDQEALIREIKEELDVDLIPETIKYLNTFKTQAHGKEGGILVQITSYTAKHKGEIKPTSEIEEVLWINSQTDVSILDEMDLLILYYLKNRNLVD